MVEILVTCIVLVIFENLSIMTRTFSFFHDVRMNRPRISMQTDAGGSLAVVFVVSWYSSLNSASFMRSVGTSERFHSSRMLILESRNPFWFWHKTFYLLNGQQTKHSGWCIRCASSWSAAHWFGFLCRSCVKSSMKRRYTFHKPMKDLNCVFLFGGLASRIDPTLVS